MFEFIPAIDLLDGKVVRLYKGRYDDVTNYDIDPASMIEKFTQAGATLIHIVDLNAARDGKIDVNKIAIEKIRATIKNGVRMEIGGGIRNISIVKEYLGRGVDRVIIGTAAVKDPGFVSEAINSFGPQKIIIGVDALEGSVRVSGWQEDSKVNVDTFLQNIEARGVQEIIFTDISTDGAMTGPAIDALQHVLKTTSLRVVASGGISSLPDLQKLLNLRHDRLVGAISGKAIYENKIDVAEAVSLCQDF